MKIAFIGMGIMGSRMASHLVEKEGVELWVYNRTPDACQPLVDRGAILAESVEECVENASQIFTMLSTPEVVRSVMLQDLVLSKIGKGARWIDCTTVDAEFSRECLSEAEDRHFHFYDSPVAGSKPQAEAGELVFLIGAKEEELGEVRPLMEYMSKKIICLGDSGKGAAMKMIVNVLLAQAMVQFSEALAFGQELGLDRDLMLDMLPNFPVVAPFIKMKTEAIRSGNFEAQFPLEWMQKDLRLAISAFSDDFQADSIHFAHNIYKKASEAGLGRADFSAIADFLKA